MTAEAFLQYLSQAIFALIFLVVAVKAIRQSRRANLDIALLFGAIALIIAEAWVTRALNVHPGRMLTAAVSSLLMALPYLLLRLVDDFAGVPRTLIRAGALGLALSVVSLFIWHGSHLPLLLVLLLVAYFVALSGYIVAAVARAARYSSGITRRRMQAVALGTLSLGLLIAAAGVEAASSSSPMWFWTTLGDVLSLTCGLSYFVGFAPPVWLRRAWQEPELRAFLGRAASLPRLPDTPAIVSELEHGAARSLGTSHAVIGLWNESQQELEFGFETEGFEQPLADSIARQAFTTQRPVFSDDALRDNPSEAALYRARNVNSVLAVPVTAGDRRLGVLAIYAARAPIFAEDDLTLAQLLADQAAVILESRALIDEAARVQAREEATRLKDDFLSAAAHDLKTPLTALIAQAQLMERRAKRNPDVPADLAGIQRMIRDSQRLRQLVIELLDVGRVEQGKLLGNRQELDLVRLVGDSCHRLSSPHHRWLLDAKEPVIGSYDAVRITQLVDNLLENAVKYSPNGGEVRVRVWREGDEAHLSVSDCGIGIPVPDLPHLFDRFHRGSNVDDRRFSGMGLGLFICRGIAEQHGGRLSVSSPGPNQGSTFHVVLPAWPAASLTAPAPQPDGATHAVLLAQGEPT